MENKIAIILIILLLGINTSLVYLSTAEKTNILGVGGNPLSVRPSIGYNSSTAVVATAIPIFRNNLSAQVRIVSNVGVADAWISATTTNLKANFGFWLKGSTTQVFSGDSLYPGAWYASSTAGGTTISTLEL